MKKSLFGITQVLSLLVFASFAVSTKIHAAAASTLNVTKKSIFVNKDEQDNPVYASILDGCNKIQFDHRDVSATMMSLVIATEYAKQTGQKEPKFNLCDLIIAARNAAYSEKKSKQPCTKKKKQECPCTKATNRTLDLDSASNQSTPAKHRAINFCQYNLGIERKDMPQLSGKPVNNTCLAAQLADEGLAPRSSSGEIDLTEIFVGYLKNKGYKVTIKNVDAFQLKATQKELVASKVAAMWLALKMDPNNKDLKASIFTAQREDDASYYILDGHHRWAAIMATEFGLSHLTRVFIPAKVVNTDIENLLIIANKFTVEYGIAVKAGS